MFQNYNLNKSKMIGWGKYSLTMATVEITLITLPNNLKSYSSLDLIYSKSLLKGHKNRLVQGNGSYRGVWITYNKLTYSEI